MLFCCTSVCRSCWLLCGPGRGWELQSSEPRPPHRSGYSVGRWMSGWIKTTGWKYKKKTKKPQTTSTCWSTDENLLPHSQTKQKPQSCVTLHTLLAVWALSTQPGVDSKADSAYDTTAFTTELKGLQHGWFEYSQTAAPDICQYFIQFLCYRNH